MGVIWRIATHPAWPFITGITALAGGIAAARNPEMGVLYAVPVLAAGILLIASGAYLLIAPRRRRGEP